MRDSYFDLPSRIEDAFAEIDSDIVMDLLNHVIIKIPAWFMGISSDRNLSKRHNINLARIPFVPQIWHQFKFLKSKA